MNRLDPTLDLVFKLLLTREPALLLDMLRGILQRPLLAVTILDRDIPGALARDKSSILDIRALLDDGSRADVEMQKRTPEALASRLVYYGARDFGDQLLRGDGYHLLTPTAVIAWLVDPLFPQLERLHSIFELRERETHALFGEQLAIHVLQLGSLSSPPTNGYAAIVHRWARFFAARDDHELDRLASENSIMALATQTLDSLSQDPETYRLARERADALRLYQIDLAAREAAGEAKGRAAGEAKGKSQLLLKQLELRFGPLSETVRARVETAASERLDEWAEQVLTARSIDEILVP